VEKEDAGRQVGTVKYICRVGKKNDELEDLKKARWYLDRKIQILDAARRRKTAHPVSRAITSEKLTEMAEGPGDGQAVS
jgi:hypothetical protein